MPPARCATTGASQPPRYRAKSHHRTKGNALSEPATTEEVRQLRTAVHQLTMMVHAMYQEMVKRDHVPVPAFSRHVGDLRISVIDPQLRKLWEQAREANDPYVREAAERQHPD